MVDKEGLQKLNLGSHVLVKLLPNNSTGLTNQPTHTAHCHAQGLRLET